jgi:hypothetical protein
MKRVSVIVVATASTLVLSAAAWRSERPLNARESHARAENARLRAHFDSVDTELRTRDVSHLSAAQRASRTKLIGWLREYRDAGRFPQNDRFADEMVPFFRDSQGTLCAMAYLVDRSGRGDIVDHIARTRNNAYIHELTDDRELVAWLEASGLSVSEAARIQPAYNGDPCCPIPDGPATPEIQVGNKTFATLSVGFGGVSLGTLGFNLLSPSRISGAAGVLTGAATIITGVTYLANTNPGRNDGVAKADIAVGSIAVIAGLHALVTRGSSRERTPTQASKQALLSETMIAPDLIVSPNATRFGLRMQARF